ncbi:MAG: tyrosine-type recombinase/integrase [Halobacteriota archaeon]
MPKLTDLTIKNATEGIMWDDAVHGLGVRKGKNRTTFIVLIGSGRRHRIGHYPAMSLADARKEAKERLAHKTLGAIKPKQHAFDDAKDDFLASKADQKKTVYEYTRILNRHFPFVRKNIADIQPRTIVQILNRIEKPIERNHACVAGKVFFNWCVRQQIIDRSPMENIETPNKGSPRERILTNSELCELTQALSTHVITFTRICLLLLYTGQRKGEISRLKWHWIDEANRTITLPRTKNQLQHTYPYGTTVQKILDDIPRYEDCPYLFPAARTVSDKTTVFNGWSKAKARLDELVQIPEWTLHDLRRTFSSGMAALGVPQIVVEKLLNHVSGGVQSTISRTYNRHHYLPEMREAVLKWDKYLCNLSQPAE